MPGGNDPRSVVGLLQPESIIVDTFTFQMIYSFPRGTYTAPREPKETMRNRGSSNDFKTLKPIDQYDNIPQANKI